MEHRFHRAVEDLGNLFFCLVSLALYKHNAKDISTFSPDERSTNRISTSEDILLSFGSNEVVSCNGGEFTRKSNSQTSRIPFTNSHGGSPCSSINSFGERNTKSPSSGGYFLQSIVLMNQIPISREHSPESLFKRINFTP